MLHRNAHRLAELRSLAYHVEVARRIAADASLVARARLTVDDLVSRGVLHSEYASRWKSLLNGPIETLVATLEADDDSSAALRKTSPFAGVIRARERWSMWKQTRRSFEESTK